MSLAATVDSNDLPQKSVVPVLIVGDLDIWRGEPCAFYFVGLLRIIVNDMTVSMIVGTGSCVETCC